MYTSLSSTQQAVLEKGECPHCHTTGTVHERWTRNGPTVACDSCGKKVYRPRGRAVSAGHGLDGGSGGGNSVDVQGDNQTSDGPNDQETEQRDGGQTESQSQSQSQSKSQSPSQASKPSQAAQKAGEKIGKPLSDAAKDAISKIEQALREQLTKDLQSEKQKLQAEAQKQQEAISQEIAEQVETLRPKEILVKRQESDGSEQTTTIPNAHPLLTEVLRRISAGLMNFLLVGPSGSGKTTLVRQVAEALGLPYSVTPWSAGLTEGGVLGRLTPDGTYLPSSYVLAFEQASVHNWDEIDAADPNVPLCANSGIENGEIFLPARVASPRAARHAKAYLFATANTWGIGADMLFVGRNQMDAAFRSRFAGGMFYCDYSADLERQLVPEQSYREAFWAVRARIYEHKLRRIWGTRELIRGAQLLRADYSMREVFTVLSCGWTQDELSKVGI